MATTIGGSQVAGTYSTGYRRTDEDRSVDGPSDEQTEVYQPGNDRDAQMDAVKALGRRLQSGQKFTIRYDYSKSSNEQPGPPETTDLKDPGPPLLLPSSPLAPPPVAPQVQAGNRFAVRFDHAQQY